jgi:hypothetical protein
MPAAPPPRTALRTTCIPYSIGCAFNYEMMPRSSNRVSWRTFTALVGFDVINVRHSHPYRVDCVSRRSERFSPCPLRNATRVTPHVRWTRIPGHRSQHPAPAPVLRRHLVPHRADPRHTRKCASRDGRCTRRRSDIRHRFRPIFRKPEIPARHSRALHEGSRAVLAIDGSAHRRMSPARNQAHSIAADAARLVSHLRRAGAGGLGPAITNLRRDPSLNTRVRDPIQRRSDRTDVRTVKRGDARR